MKFLSKVHGEMQYEENNVITFAKGIPGFDELKKFILINLEEYEPFKLMQSLEDDDISLIVTSPYEFFGDYEIKLSDETTKNLEIKHPEEVMVLTTITLNSDVQKITTNLQGPIIINTSNNFGEQIILDNSKYRVKSPLM
ncbi:flagellar assembly protein FliW [Clostridium saccharobutylicum]|uniref:Flagellar assembly factor FliW n=1 Tax=Clostridium saccharobutylicum DSM 13864 TaxID=1345695 RepID=U5MWH6_CLOSA|nr:flagellar assembly protein FliW [Clostridium saccharobutylicum]AGX44930.1 flagellar assembly factor FliW [Clostridium saccharobutylicum DSM 13864]AQR92212.1 flagellar assembly factor FliW [Clostridium saccharobutylicum]AQS02114.1 flagellar assembly factor FliW [Clostridium saccharobutylicum]AQS11718.1 flagellar assembly factor FliW [Clostridium saccharobutylicum]AQS16097.1 flagellar assembly factor FliW [Clostridium saccharobutylicum]